MPVGNAPVPKPPDTDRNGITPRPHISELTQSALLIHRTEPIYPPIAKQLGREGRVELHAIFATDGSIQALEVISGDPLLVKSALMAVREWQYRPTILNATPVEVDTHITVIYRLNR